MFFSKFSPQKKCSFQSALPCFIMGGTPDPTVAVVYLVKILKLMKLVKMFGTCSRGLGYVTILVKMFKMVGACG